MSFHSVIILENALAAEVGPMFMPQKNKRSFQAVVEGVGQVDAVVQVLGSNDGVNLVETEMGEITLSGAAGISSDGFTTDAPWKYVAAKVISITAGAKLKVIMGE